MVSKALDVEDEEGDDTISLSVSLNLEITTDDLGSTSFFLISLGEGLKLKSIGFFSSLKRHFNKNIFFFHLRKRSY